MALDRIRRSLRRDRGLPLRALARKVLRFGLARLTAPLWLRACSRVGAQPRTAGRPHIVNRGEIVLGRGVVLNSTLGAVSMESDPGGRIEIGDDVFLNFGACLRSRARITLGRNVAVAPLCLIDDSAEGGGRPIEIGSDVWLGARVVIRGGACIGAGATITAGSEVTGIIPPGAIAGGRPARVLRLAASSSERPEERR